MNASPWVAGAAALLLALGMSGCSDREHSRSSDSGNVTVDAAPPPPVEEPAPVPEPAAPAPKPPAQSNTLGEVKEPSLSADAQVQEDAAASGMTSRTARRDEPAAADQTRNTQ